MEIALMLAGGGLMLLAVGLMVTDALRVIRAGETLTGRQLRERATPMWVASAVVGLLGIVIFSIGAELPS